MADPWFANPSLFGALYGAIVGGLGGTMGGLLGALAGKLAPQGKGRRLILGGMAAFVVFGAANLVVGVVALAVGQPYGIWYPFILCGLIFTIVMGCLLPVARMRYREAEERRMQAEGIRST